MDLNDFNRSHAPGFLWVGVIELLTVTISAKIFGFSVIDTLLLKIDAATLFVLGGYAFIFGGIYLLFQPKPKEPRSVVKGPGSN